MTDHELSVQRQSGDESFDSRLQELVHSAHESGVDVEGGYEIRDGDGTVRWELQIVEMA